MKEFIPKYILENNIDCLVTQFEQDESGYRISFYIKKDGESNFIVSKAKHSISPKLMQYRKRIKELQEKYKHLLVDGTCFTTSFKDNRMYFGYNNPNKEDILLEDISDLKNLLVAEDVPEIIIITTPLSNEVIKLFDSSKNGYDAIVKPINCSDRFVKFKKKTKCHTCSCETYKVYMNIHSTGKNDLLEDQVCEYITEENWTNAFDWISIDLECSNCGKKIKRWFELETM